jgi:hypothetical protein
MKKINKEQVAEAASTLLMVLFIYAGGVKLADLNTFTAELRQSPLMPLVVAPVVAVAVPAVELCLAAMLFVNKYKALGFLLSYLLMVFFTFYLLVLTSFFDSSQIPCACGGILGKTTYGVHIVINVLFTVIALVGCLLTFPKTSLNTGQAQLNQP